MKTSAHKRPQFFTTNDPRIAWEHFRPIVLTVDTNNLQFFRRDVHIGMHNVKVGLEAVEPLLETLSLKAPEISQSELLELPALGLALSYAVGRCPVTQTASRREIAAKVDAISESRELTVSYLRLFSRVHPDLIPAGRVASFGQTKGPLGMASDAVQAAGMFHEFAGVLANKHPFTDKYLADMAETAAWLVTTLKPGNAIKRTAPRTPESIERDQFASVFEARHDMLRTAGVVLFGIKNVDAKVPPLYSATHEVSAEETADNGATEPKPTG